MPGFTELSETTWLTAGQARGLEKTTLSASTPTAHHLIWEARPQREGSVGTHHPALPTCMWPPESLARSVFPIWVEAEAVPSQS